MIVHVLFTEGVNVNEAVDAPPKTKVIDDGENVPLHGVVGVMVSVEPGCCGGCDTVTF